MDEKPGSMKEFTSLRQITGQGFRRLFFDDYFDLFVWYDSNLLIEGFQLCYDIKGYQRALTWKAKEGFHHDGIDTGDTWETLVAKSVPTLVTDGEFDFRAVAQRFQKASSEIDPTVYEVVNKLIRIYARKLNEVYGEKY